MTLDERARSAADDLRRQGETVVVPDPGTFVRQRRRRRHVFQASALVLCIVLVLGAALFVLTRDDNEVAVDTRSTPSTSVRDGSTVLPNTRAGLSIVLPPGWQQLPLADGGNPAEILNVGTAPMDDRPVTCPHDFPSTGLYVSIAEYPVGDPGFNTRSSPNLYPLTRPGPRNFTRPLWVEQACSTADGEPAPHTIQAEFRFRDRNRQFDAVIVAGVDAKRERAIRVLDSFKVTKPGEAQARVRRRDAQEIRAAFLGWLNEEPHYQVAEYVEDFESVRDTVAQAIAFANGVGVFDYSGGTVDYIAPKDEDEARVWYRRVRGPNGGESVTEGTAVKVDGAWKVSRDTVCGMLARSGPIRCPE